MLAELAAKEVISTVKPHIDPLLSALIKPMIGNLVQKLDQKRFKIKATDLEKTFEEYLIRTYQNVAEVNVLIFPNEQVKIKDIYQPLTIYSENKRIKYKIDKVNIEILDEHKKILIADTAGMGKSTLAKWITLKLLIENKTIIPVLIELRNLKENYTILDEISFQLSSISTKFDTELLLKFLELGVFVFILDGFDEIQVLGQDEIVRNLREFIKKASNNHFILTSRKEAGLSSFGDFQSFSIERLTMPEAFELIRKYDAISPVKISQSLISDLEPNYEHSSELLGNPFLISLLYSTYTYNKEIPASKSSFYEEIYSALFKKHDLSKTKWTRPKKCNLDILQFKKLLRQLAFDTALKKLTIFTENEIIDFIEKAKDKCPDIEIQAQDFLEDLLLTVPLFQKDGLKIKWAHKSLQDYFAAEFIVFDKRKEEILKKIYDSQRDDFLNILDFIYELDYKSFRRIIIRPLLEEYLEFYKSTYKDFAHIPKELIDMRKAKTFAASFVFASSEEELLLISGKLGDVELMTRRILDKVPNFKTYGAFGITHTLHYTIAISYGFKRALLGFLAQKKAKFYSLPKITRIYPREKFAELVGFNLVNDENANWINSIENFEKITNLIPDNHYFRQETKTGIIQPDPLLDYEKVLEELESINREIKAEEEDIFADL